MKTKQIIVIFAILIFGILIGKFVLKSSSSEQAKNHEHETKEEHWTCSMHPQIDMPEFGQCPICGMDLIPKEKDSDDSLAVNSFKMSKNAIALANIETTTVGGENEINQQTKNNSMQLSGKIMVNNKATAMQTAHFGGRIENLKYRSVGEYVKKGSLLATVYSPELVTAQNEFIEALEIKNAQPELYKAVRNKLKNWKISENQIQQIEQTKKVITNFNMYANVSGYIDEILVQEGSHLNEGTPMFKVSNLGNVWAMFDVYEQDIKNIKIGQKIIITANAYPNKEIKAIINYIDPNLNIVTRTVQIRATLKNIGTTLKPGMLLLGKIAIKNTLNNKKTNLVSVPKTAVMWTGKRSVVYVKTSKDEPVFELREVTLGSAVGANYQVLEGLEKGEEIVVNGTFTVDAAAQLRGKSSMMHKKTENKEQDVKHIDINPKFKKQINVVLENYFNLKDAFVLTNTKKVSEQALQTLASLKKVNMGLLKKPEAHKIWMPAVKIIKTTLQTISNATNIEKQRAEFIDLSNAMLAVISSFGAGEQEVYVAHCPMANKNKGADWLSLNKTIKNPYFGDKMMSCGSVEQIIK